MKNNFKLWGIIVVVAAIGLLMTGCPILRLFTGDYNTNDPPVAEEGGGHAVTGVTVAPATVSVARGGMQNFTAMVLGPNNPPQNVEWSVDGWSWTYINASGGLVVCEYETNPRLTVVATSAFGWISGTASVHVPQPAVDSVTVNPADVVVERGASMEFDATVLGTNNPTTAVSWSVGGHGGWEYGTRGTDIYATGLTTARLTVALNEPASRLTVRAISMSDMRTFGTATVTVPDPVY